MSRVQSAERDLRELGLVWQMIESSAAISCPQEVATILPTLTTTRDSFGALRTHLTEQMVAESRAELGDELSAKAQCAIDILVRNLFERTADVGFLATDDVVRAFCAAAPEQRAAGQAAMQRRLMEYQAKYSVYDDVILLAPDGRVLVRLDAGSGPQISSDPLVGEALAERAYVERFRASDLGRGAAPALLYAHRIESADGATVGVLVLRFRFEDEMQRIFAGVADERHGMALVLLDDAQQVVASNDTAHVPLGAKLPAVPTAEVTLTSFAGREYLAVACVSPGYQGYAGPRWRAQAMVSLLTAFRQRGQSDADTDTAALSLDNAQLGAIARDADHINRNLRRVVWNGRLMAGGQAGDRARLKAVLGQVSQAGARTRDRVNLAIGDLYRTSLARARHQARELARLAADIMDRNLYERANDCRWWALSPVLQRLLAAPASEAGHGELCALLDHVNGLYTVYSRLVAFDAEGVIRAASRGADAPSLVGTTIAPDWSDRLRSLSDSQQYAVSRFEATTLHEHGETYVYLAAVRDGGRPVGGIAIVFNAAREFAAMLRDVIGERSGCAAFVDTSGRVLAASEAAVAAGLATAADGPAALIEFDGQHYACARVPASGYREFKKSDGYDNQVGALVALRLGRVERRRHSFSDVDLRTDPLAQPADALEVAVFQVGALRYALPATAVLEAISPRGLVRTPGGSGLAIGMLEVRSGAGAVLVHALCARRLFGIDYPARATDGVVLVLRSPQQPDRPALGLRVDDVLSVLEVDRRRLNDAPDGLRSYAPCVAGLIDCQAGDDSVLVQLLDPATLVATLLPRAAAAPLESEAALATVF